MKIIRLPRQFVIGVFGILLASTVTAAVSPNTTLTADQLASRFLAQATFGPSAASIAELRALNNDFNLWITQQAALPVTLSVSYLDAGRAAGLFTTSDTNYNRRARNQAMLSAPDQLRQRMAYALSQIMVISDQDTNVANGQDGSSSYYDMLARNALGNYRTLMMDVTRHPMMGRYLSHYKNRKADAALGTRPDENYGREIMQLFTIGLYNLNSNGTIITSGGRPVESYTDTQITEFSRVFTGFTDESTNNTGTGTGRLDFPSASQNYTAPMRMWDLQHDVGAKTLFNYPGARKPTLPANQTGLQDVADALDNIVEHPNTAPFISKLLIQRLVTSHPSPAYVARVAAVFVNNGSGVRGDLLAVARAILTDTEARSTASITTTTHGRLQDPFLRLTNILRAFNFTVTTGTPDVLRYDFGGSVTQNTIAHYPMSSPSVFNFWSPDYAPSGPIATANLVAPEFQVLNSVFSVTIPNTIYNLVQNASVGNFRLNLTPYETLAANPAGLIDELNTLLCHGTMSTETRTAILTAVNGVTTTMGSNVNQNRMRLAVYLTAISPDCTIQK